MASEYRFPGTHVDVVVTITSSVGLGNAVGTNTRQVRMTICAAPRLPLTMANVVRQAMGVTALRPGETVRSIEFK